MMIAKRWSFLVLVLVVLPILCVEARATTCVQGPLEQDLEAADAIFVGEITAVRYRRWFEASGLCATHSHGPRCGEKVARVTVSRVWKGEIDHETFVYAEDGCNCLGGYFGEGEQRVFIVRRSTEGAFGLGPIDYRTAFCGRNDLLERALDNGIIESLDAHFPGTP